MSTNLKYGVNFTESDARKWLEQNDADQKGIRSWRTLLGGASIGYNAGRDAALSSFSDTVAQAYDASLVNKNAIYGAGLSAGTTKNLLRDNASSLHQAYESALSNYNKNLTAVADAYNTEVSAINEGLNERAKNIVSLMNSSYDYLSQELLPAAQYLSDNGLDWVLDENGVLKSWDTLRREMTNDDDTLNARGIEFFDQIYNTQDVQTQNYTVLNNDGTTRAMRGFDQWLSDTNPELRAWYVSPDEFNYNKLGTNAGTLNIYTGRESDDFLYNKNDYKVYNTDKLNELSTKLNEFSTKYNKSAVAKRDEAYNAERKPLEANLQDAKLKLEAAAKAGRGSKDDSQLRYAYSVYNAAQTALKDAEQRYNEAGSWATYKSSVSTVKDDLTKYLTDELGSGLSDAFWKENQDMLKEYEALIERVKGSSSYDEKLVSYTDSFYKKLLQRADKYVQDKSYRVGQHSGY